jgi:hypothetical protein
MVQGEGYLRSAVRFFLLHRTLTDPASKGFRPRPLGVGLPE